ncbi:MAG: hypothetical protein ACI9L9_000292 [Marivirga sp.]|jgi:hypothetical protein
MFKFNYYKLIVLTLLVVQGGSLIAQSFNREKLLSIAEEQSEIAADRQNRVEAYLKLNPSERKVFYTVESGEAVVLFDVVNGKPQYKSTYNEQARLTTGVDYVQSAEGLNLPLFGQDLTIGVWDGGLVLSSHVEFGGRVFNKLGSEYSNHATHVTGTIAAAGVDPKAKGMLPEATINSYYAFDDDLGPMAVEAADGLILSNHSYGLVLGWRFNGGWTWFGGADDKDETFGAYTNNSKAIDNITYNAPYYTIVWAAGNDRSDAGDGSRPPDGPFDIIGPSAGAKNVITVGAITGFDEYVGPESAEMSSFSSWGPTNDGRIKPDIVADGVGVYSPGSAGDESYASLSGTSMASPNTTGTLGVIQQYYRSKEDTFMLASQLKSLMIHTAREAGQNIGPDYKYGWGVINAIDAIKMIQGQASEDTVLLAATLANTESHVYEIFSDGRTPITATIAWTDLPGTVREETSILPNLVNDLDITLVDDLGNEILPWTLDPASVGKAAIKAVNNVDNVEKIDFPNPEARKYRLIVSHKNRLENDKQTYGLTLSYNKANVSSNISYWINGSGSFISDSHFALTSGGESASIGASDVETIVIDENSFTTDGTIMIDTDVTLNNLVFTSDDKVTIDLDGNVMQINSPMYISNDKLKIRNGILRISNANSQNISLNFDGTDSLSVELIQQTGIGEIDTDVMLSNLTFVEGRFNIVNRDMAFNSLKLNNDTEVVLEKNTISLEGIFVANGNITATSNIWSVSNTIISADQRVSLLDEVNTFGSTIFESQLVVKTLRNEGELTLMSGLMVDSMMLKVGSNLTLMGTDSVIVNEHIDLDQAADGVITIVGEVVQPSTFVYNRREKLCVDNLQVSDIDFTSESVMNVGNSSTLINTLNILQIACDELLFADFEIIGNCSNSLVSLKDISDGSIADYSWSIVGQEHFVQNMSSTNPVIWFDEPGDYQVALTITNEAQTESFIKTITITANDLAATQIVETEQGLVATANASSYRWFYNGETIPDATERILSNTNVLQIGSYHVAYFKEGACGSRVSGEFVLNTITGINKPFVIKPVIYPNPFKKQLTINQLEKGDKITIIDVKGKLIFEKQARSSSEIINLKDNQNQLLILKIQRRGHIFNQKIIQTQ